jgi:hypothetical protein
VHNVVEDTNPRPSRSQSRKKQHTQTVEGGEEAEKEEARVEKRAKEQRGMERVPQVNKRRKGQAFATINCAGYNRHRVREVGKERKHAQLIGVHEAIEKYLRRRRSEGRPIMMLAVQETWLKEGEQMMPFEGFKVHLRSRTGGQSKRGSGGVAILVADELDWKTETEHGQGYGGSEGMMWQTVQSENSPGSFGNMYFDSPYFRQKMGVDEETMWVAMEWDVKERMKRGWVILAGDFNCWIGCEEDGAGKGRDGFGESNAGGKRFSEFLKATGLVCVHGRMGRKAAPTRVRYKKSLLS